MTSSTVRQSDALAPAREDEPPNAAKTPHPKTRARVRTRDSLAPSVVAIRLPTHDRRTPRVMADLAIGDLVLTFTLARLRNRTLDIRVPATMDGEPALAVKDDLWDVIKQTLHEAVGADPAARARLRRSQW